MINIDNCFTIGYRCTADSFLKYLNIRKYSGPFSYMVIDLETALYFIKNNFKNYFDVISIKNHNYLWNNKKWSPHLYFNKKFIPNNIEISKNKRICCWNHHDLSSLDVKNSINRRINHLLYSLKTNNTLLLYISNIKINKDESKSLIKLSNDFLININSKYVYILILCPLINYENNPIINKISNNINIIYYKSNMEGHINDITNNKIRWDLVKKLILENYNFNIKERNYSL